MGQVVFVPIEEQLTGMYVSCRCQYRSSLPNSDEVINASIVIGKSWPPTRSPRLPGLVFAETEQFQNSHRLSTSTRFLIACADAFSIVV